MVKRTILTIILHIGLSSNSSYTSEYVNAVRILYTLQDF